MIKYYWNKFIKKIRGAAIKNSRIDKSSKIEAGSQVVNTCMDKYSFCGYDCKLINSKIGSFCSIGDNVSIGGAQHPIAWASTSPAFYYGKDSISTKFAEFKRDIDLETVIGHDVWIGEGALIKAGVTIGNGSVIGMGSVVTKNIDDYEIWAGNPARFIRKRFDQKTIEMLQQSEWWNLTPNQLEKYSKYIRNPNTFAEMIIGKGLT